MNGFITYDWVDSDPYFSEKKCIDKSTYWMKYWKRTTDLFTSPHTTKTVDRRYINIAVFHINQFFFSTYPSKNIRKDQQVIYWNYVLWKVTQPADS